MKKSAMTRRQLGIYLAGAIAATVAEAATRPAAADPAPPPNAAPSIETRLADLENSRQQFETTYDAKLTQAGADFQAKLDTVNMQLSQTITALTALKDRLRSTPPIGTILMLAYDAAPLPGFLLCDGTTYTMADRPDLDMLRQAIGRTWGGDGTTTFAVPELRGVFPRFHDKEKGTDAGRQLGKFQDWGTHMPQNAFTTAPSGTHSHDGVTHAQSNPHSHPINHNVTCEGASNNADRGGDVGLQRVPTITAGANDRDHTHGITPAPDHVHPMNGGDPETRPINQALVGYIKF